MVDFDDGVPVAISHAGHSLPKRAPDLDDTMALRDGNLLLDLGDEPLGLARPLVNAQEVLGVDGAGIAVRELRLQPLPGADPIVALFLLQGPHHALFGSLGLANAHDAVLVV
jgi:hypothetical protein